MREKASERGGARERGSEGEGVRERVRKVRLESDRDALWIASSCSSVALMMRVVQRQERGKGERVCACERESARARVSDSQSRWCSGRRVREERRECAGGRALFFHALAHSAAGGHAEWV